MKNKFYRYDWDNNWEIKCIFSVLTRLVVYKRDIELVYFLIKFFFFFNFYLGDGSLMLSRQLSAEEINSLLGIILRTSFTNSKLNKENQLTENLMISVLSQ